MKNKAVRISTFSVAAAGFAFFLPLLAGCGSGSSSGSSVLTTPTPTPSPSDGPETTRAAYQDLQYTFTVQKHNYALGEAVPMTFTIKNTGSTDATFRNTVGPFVDVSIQNLDGRYLSSIDGFDRTDVTNVTRTATAQKEKPAATRLLPVYTLLVAAGQTRTFTLQWNQSVQFFTPEPGPTQATSGSYVLTGEISPENLDGKPGLPAPPITITIQPASSQ